MQIRGGPEEEKRVRAHLVDKQQRPHKHDQEYISRRDIIKERKEKALARISRDEAARAEARKAAGLPDLEEPMMDLDAYWNKMVGPNGPTRKMALMRIAGIGFTSFYLVLTVSSK